MGKDILNIDVIPSKDGFKYIFETDFDTQELYGVKNGQVKGWLTAVGFGKRKTKDPKKGTFSDRTMVLLTCKCGAKRTETPYGFRTDNKRSCSGCNSAYLAENPIPFKAKEKYLPRLGARKHQVGDVLENGIGQKFTVKEWVTFDEIYVQFEDGVVVKTNNTQLLSGNIKNKLSPRIFGVGYMGNGEFKCRVNGKMTREYSMWEAMIKRVYAEENHTPTYADCEVCESWHNFQNFAQWVTNLPQWNQEGWQLDKDISKSRVYSSDTCFLVPRIINNMFVNRKKRDLPRGVSRYKDKFVGSYGSYRSGGRGVFGTVDEARKFWFDGMTRLLSERIDAVKDSLDPMCVKLLEEYDLEEL